MIGVTFAANVVCETHTMQRLAIYVSAGCLGCERAHEVAALVRSGHPEVEVDVIDVAGHGVDVPESVVAVPTYLLDGVVISLGNPDPDTLRQRLIAPGAPREV